MTAGDEIGMTARRLLSRLLLATLASLCSPPSFAATVSEISADEILRRADAVRIPQEAFEVGVDIPTTVDGQPQSK